VRPGKRCSSSASCCSGESARNRSRRSRIRSRSAPTSLALDTLAGRSPARAPPPPPARGSSAPGIAARDRTSAGRARRTRTRRRHRTPASAGGRLRRAANPPPLEGSTRWNPKGCARGPRRQRPAGWLDGGLRKEHRARARIRAGGVAPGPSGQGSRADPAGALVVTPELSSWEN
jgi:hypothetical protein